MDLVKALSEFIGFPNELYVEKSKEKEVTDSEDVDEEKMRRKVRWVMSPVSLEDQSAFSEERRLKDLG